MSGCLTKVQQCFSAIQVSIHRVFISIIALISLQTNVLAAVTIDCDGSGRSDASACINSYLNSGERTIHFPSNQNYLISDKLWVPAGRTVNGNNSRVFMRRPASGILDMLGIGGSNVTLRNLWLDYQGPYMSDAPVANLRIYPGVSNINIENNYFTGSNSISARSGIELSYDGVIYNSDCAISGNQIAHSGFFGILVGGLASQPVNSWIGPLHTQDIAGNQTFNSGKAGIKLMNSPGGTMAIENSGN